jgi:hypothetical protein
MNIIQIISLFFASFFLLGGLIELIAAIKLNYYPFLLEGVGMLLLGVFFVARVLSIPFGVETLLGGIGSVLIAVFRHKYENDRRSREITIWKLFQNAPSKK